MNLWDFEFGGKTSVPVTGCILKNSNIIQFPKSPPKCMAQRRNPPEILGFQAKIPDGVYVGLYIPRVPLEITISPLASL
jgi:hypothetical protein